jgi:plastocyanin
MYTAPATGGSDTITASAGGLTGSTTLTITDGVPTVATPASASPSPVTGKTTALSVLGADDGGESDLTYAWSTINGSPSGVTFSDNSDNSAKDTTATFTQSGTYHFQVTITNPLGLFTTSSVTVDVAQTLTSVVVTPPAATLDEIATRTFTAAGFDQFGAVMSPEPTFAWTLVSGIGSIDSSSGEYTSPSQPGVATITATSGVVSGAAHVAVNNAAPTVATPASASPSPVTGTSTVLSVLGADDGGESNLTYTWLATTEPSGSSPQFSINGTNAAKDTTVTFDKAGDYTFTVTIDDGQGGTVASTVNVTVAQTLTAISVGPSNTDINENSSQQFAATGYDQFGNVLTTPPIFQWTNTGAGSVDSSGLYTAPAAAGFDTVFASNDGVRGSAHLTITDGVPTVVTPASVPSPTVAGTAAALSVLGDDDGGESDLTYTWTTTGTPPANVTFSENGDNAAKDATATFTKAGTYDFLVTIENPIGLFTTSSVTVTVNQTLTRIVVTPPTTTIDENATQPFTAVGYDQFGLPMATQPTFAWGLSSGVGSVATDTGVYTSPGISGVATVVASSAAVSGSANITVANAEPTVAIPASAAPSPVTGTTTNLSVLGADDGGESNLRYTWVTTARPTNGYPLFSVNGTNSAKDSTVTFDKAGDYTFACTISDGQGGSVFSSVSVTVLQTLSQLKVTASPGTSVSTDGTVNLTALELDQFARPMAEEAPIAWSVSSGSGTVSSDGVFVASSQAGAVVVEAAVGSLSGTITLTVGATTPLTVVPSRNPPPPPGPGSDGGDSTRRSRQRLPSCRRRAPMTAPFPSRSSQRPTFRCRPQKRFLSPPRPPLI